MAKRFTDTDKWKKPFVRKLSTPAKLLWSYILDDCDITGLWHVDIDVAVIRTGEPISATEFLKEVGDRVIQIDDGEKWFIPSFITFQYGLQLSKTNNIYKSIEKILVKYDLFKYLEVDITQSGTTINSFRSRLSQKTKDEIINRDEFRCQYCSEQKTKAELFVDHFIPLNRGGDNSDENLVSACSRCNSHKTDTMPDVFILKAHDFIKPTNYLNGLINKLKGGDSVLLVPKDKDKDKVKEMVKDKDREKKKVKHPFSESEFYDLSIFTDMLENSPDPYCKVDPKYYYESAKNGSEAKGYKYLDWSAAIKNWIRNDEKKGELRRKPVVNNMSNANPQHLTGIIQ
jgi:hypothetical protein